MLLLLVILVPFIEPRCFILFVCSYELLVGTSIVFTFQLQNSSLRPINRITSLMIVIKCCVVCQQPVVAGWLEGKTNMPKKEQSRCWGWFSLSCYLLLPSSYIFWYCLHNSQTTTTTKNTPQLSNLRQQSCILVHTCRSAGLGWPKLGLASLHSKLRVAQVTPHQKTRGMWSFHGIDKSGRKQA